jgi:hypothetical protein
MANTTLSTATISFLFTGKWPLPSTASSLTASKLIQENIDRENSQTKRDHYGFCNVIRN